VKPILYTERGVKRQSSQEERERETERERERTTRRLSDIQIK
jgi:hypothetical protein